MERKWPELPPGYQWDHATSPSSIVGPVGFLKYSGGGPNQAARVAWMHYALHETAKRFLARLSVEDKTVVLDPLCGIGDWSHLAEMRLVTCVAGSGEPLARTKLGDIVAVLIEQERAQQTVTGRTPSELAQQNLDGSGEKW